MDEANQPTGGGGSTDFVVKTEGHCFLCLDEVSSEESESQSTTVTPSLCSLQYLFRYLKLELRKAFSEELTLAPEVVCKLDRSRLKATLCGGCASLSDRFSELCGQLERIRMEVGECLGGIHGKLFKAGAEENWHKLREKSSSPNTVLTLQIAQALRKQTLEKCSLKLRRSQPLVLLRKLRMDTTNVSTRNDTDDNIFALLAAPVMELVTGNSLSMKTESPRVQVNIETLECDVSPFDVKPEVNEEPVVTETEAVPVTLQRSTTFNYPYYRHCSFNAATGKHQCRLCRREFSFRRHWSAHYNVVHQRGKIGGTQPLSRTSYTYDEAIRRFRCQICRKEFQSRFGCTTHIMSSHQNVKFRCSQCGHTFTQKSGLQRHYRKFHSQASETRPGPEAKLNQNQSQQKPVEQVPPPPLPPANVFRRRILECRDCGRQFGSGSGLHRHRQSVHMGLRYKCNICGVIFSQKYNLLAHQRLHHQQGQDGSTTLPGSQEEAPMGRSTGDSDNSLTVKIEDAQMSMNPVDVDTGDFLEDLLQTPHHSIGTSSEETHGGGEISHLNGANVNATYFDLEENGVNEVSVEETAPVQLQLQSQTGPPPTPSTSKARHNCPLCNMKFNHSTSLHRHHQSVHLGIRYRCRTCKLVGNYRDSIRSHQRTTGAGCRVGPEEIEVLMPTKNKKPSCSSSTAMLGSMLKNVEQPAHRADPLQMPQIAAPPPAPVWIARRPTPINPTRTTPKTWVCKYCGREFGSNSGLSRHRENVHMGLRYKCEFCNISVTQKAYLHIHQTKCSKNPNSAAAISQGQDGEGDDEMSNFQMGHEGGRNGEEELSFVELQDPLQE